MDDLATAAWRKSSRSSSQGQCVEVANLPSGTHLVRDSKNPDGTVLAVPDGQFAAALRGIVDGSIAPPC